MILLREKASAVARLHDLIEQFFFRLNDIDVGGMSF